MEESERALLAHPLHSPPPGTSAATSAASPRFIFLVLPQVVLMKLLELSALCLRSDAGALLTEASIVSVFTKVVWVPLLAWPPFEPI